MTGEKTEAVARDGFISQIIKEPQKLWRELLCNRLAYFVRYRAQNNGQRDKEKYHTNNVFQVLLVPN